MFCRIARRGTLLRGSFRTIKNVHRKSSAVWFSATSSSDEETITDDYGLYRLLTPEERGLLAEQRKLTETSRQLASKVGGSKFSVLTQSSSFLEELQLDASFSVVIAGEFNAGKSTLINALLGTKLLESGALPTTDSITIVASASSSREDIAIPLGVKMHSVKEDLPLLEDLTLIDTPGTNSAWMDHTERTLRLLPAADLILFVTSADRPFSDSERSLLKSIQSYRKSIVVVINKMDILDATGGDHGQESKQAIIDFVTDHASELLGARPTVLAVSARDALSAKIMSKSTSAPTASDHQRSNVWHRSNFGTLESFLKDSLTAQTKLKSKLSNPVGLTEGLMAQCMGTLQEQGMDLEADIATLNILQSQFEGWKKELFADMAISRQNMTDMVRKEGERGAILLSRINFYNFYAWTLFGTQQLEREWKDIKRQASAHRHKDLEADLLEQVQETADSVATRGRAQGQAIIEYLGNRPAMRNQSLVGSVTAASRFEDTRKVLGERLSNVVHSIVHINDEIAEKARLFSSLRQYSMLSASMHTCAVAAATATATELLEPTPGLMALSSLFLGGGACYMIGTSRVEKQYQQQWSNCAQQLDDALDNICKKELLRVHRRILDGVGPYIRFVETEQERIDHLRGQCEGVSSAARNLRNRISKIE